MADATADGLFCTLTPTQLRERRAFVRRALIPRVRGSNSLERGLDVYFDAGDGLPDLIEEFVALEQSCCAFLDFEIEQSGTGFTLSIRGPAEADAVLGMFRDGLTAT